MTQMMVLAPVTSTSGSSPVVSCSFKHQLSRSTLGTSANCVYNTITAGPRRPGEGTENEQQGIIGAVQLPGGAASLHITLLAAGFIIGKLSAPARFPGVFPQTYISSCSITTGPSGSSVRDIMRQTGCDIKSWTEASNAYSHRPSSTFIIEGEPGAVTHAIEIMIAAVDRYKELCEGKCQGMHSSIAWMKSI
jgi:hypothetical protein